MDIEANITLSDNDVSNLLITAFDAAYGWSNYWQDNLDDEGTLFEFGLTKDSEGEWTSVTLTATGPDAESYDTVTLDKDSLSKAFTEAHAKTTCVGLDVRRAAAEDDMGHIDAIAADVIVQIATFGKVIYG